MNFPTNTRIANTNNITFVQKTQNSSFISPFGGSQQVVSYGGEWWELDVQLNTLPQSDAAEMMAFMVGCQGMKNAFYYRLPPTFVMSAATQSITVTGNGNTFTGGSGIEVGKFGYSGTRLVLFTSTTTLFPRLATGATSVVTSGNGASFRLSSNEQTFSMDAARMGKFTVGMREAT